MAADPSATSVLGDVEEIAEGWAAAKLHQIIAPSKKRVDPRKVPADTPYVSLEHIESGTGKIPEHGRASEVRSAKSTFEPGDVLYGRLRPYLNKVAVPDFEGICSTDILVFRESEIVDPDYLRWFLAQPSVVAYASHYATGDLPRIGFKRLGEIDFLLPPRAEQARIVERAAALSTRAGETRQHVGRAYRLVDQFRDVVAIAACDGRLTAGWRDVHPDIEPGTALLETIKSERSDRHERAVRQAKKRGGRKPSRPKNLSPVRSSAKDALPAGWTWATIDELAEVGTGATPLKRNEAYYSDGTIPWVTSSAVNHPIITEPTQLVTKRALDETNLTLYPKGTLLIAMYGEGQTRGRVAELGIDATTNQALAALELRGAASKVAPYLKLFLMRNYAAVRRASFGGVQPNLSLGKVREISVPLPPLQEQREIVERAELLFGRATKIAARVSKGQDLTDRVIAEVLRKAFRGELVPTEADLAQEADRPFEPAHELLARVGQEAA